MTISWFQAAILGLFACLCSNSCMAGQAVGNYTIGRPLVGGCDAIGLHRLGYSRWYCFR